MARLSKGKVAVVGLGRMGAVHYDALIHAGFEVVTGFDQSEVARDNFAASRALKVHPMESFETVLPSLEVSGVVVATTTPARFEVFQRSVAIKSVRWVVVEKPISSSLGELSQMIELQAQSKLRVGVNHQMMFLPQYEMVRPFFESGSLGTFQSMNVSGANFGLANNVSHYFEAFRFLTGTEIQSVRGFLEPNLQPSHRGEEFWDYSGSVFAGNSQGKSLFVDFQSGIGHGIVVVYNFALGKVVVDELTGFVKVTMRKESDRAFPTGRYGLEGDSMELNFPPVDLVVPTSRLLASVASGAEEYPDLAAASHSLRSVVATILSAENGSVSQACDIDSLSTAESRVFPWS